MGAMRNYPEILFPDMREKPALFLKMHKDLLRSEKDFKHLQKNTFYLSTEMKVNEMLIDYIGRYITWPEFEDYVLKWFLHFGDFLYGHR